MEFLLAGFVEVKRWQDIRSPGSQAEPGSFLGFESSLKGKEVGYPGGPFDPLGLAKCAPQHGHIPFVQLSNARRRICVFSRWTMSSTKLGSPLWDVV